MHSNFISNLCNNIKINYRNNSVVFDTTFSKKSVSVLNILLKEGFIRGFFVDFKDNKKIIKVLLKQSNYSSGLMFKIGQNKMLKNKFYIPKTKLKSQSTGFNFSIITNRKGIMSNADAVNLKLGGIKLIDIS